MTRVVPCRRTDGRDEISSRFSRLKYRQSDYVFFMQLEATSFSFKDHRHTKSNVMCRNMGIKCKTIDISMLDLTYKNIFYETVNCKK
jgi:hypothetical protein